MSGNKPQRLSDIVPPYAAQGYHDRKWFLVEHLLENAMTDVEIAIDTLREVANWPENESERDVAKDCLEWVNALHLSALQTHATLLSYLSDTDVPERISRKEL